MMKTIAGPLEMFRPRAETDSATLYRDKDKAETNNEFISRCVVFDKEKLI